MTLKLQLNTNSLLISKVCSKTVSDLLEIKELELEKNYQKSSFVRRKNICPNTFICVITFYS